MSERAIGFQRLAGSSPWPNRHDYRRSSIQSTRVHGLSAARLDKMPSCARRGSCPRRRHPVHLRDNCPNFRKEERCRKREGEQPVELCLGDQTELPPRTIATVLRNVFRRRSRRCLIFARSVSVLTTAGDIAIAEKHTTDRRRS